MNLSYKLVKSKQSGELVVASELAKGHKKNTRKVIAASLVLIGSMGHAQTITPPMVKNIDLRYSSGILVPPLTETDKYTIKDSDNENGLGREYKINDGVTHKLTFKDAKVTYDDNGTEKPNTPAGGTYKDITFNNDIKTTGNFSIYHVKDGVKNPFDLDDRSTSDGSEYKSPMLKVLDFADEERIVMTENGEERIYIVKKIIEQTISLDTYLSNIKKKILVKDLPVPYFKFTTASTTNGTLSLSDKIYWDFGQIKQSNIFVADSNTAEAKIIADANTDFTMIFRPGAVASIKDLYIDTTENFGGTAYIGEFQNAELAAMLKTELDINIAKFTVNDKQSLKVYEEYILDLLDMNLLSQDKYDEFYNMAFKESDESYEINLKYGEAPLNHYLIDLAGLFGAPVGINSIFKANGTASSVVLENGAKLKAYYGPIAYGANGANITNNTVIALGDNTAHGSRMGNVTLVSGSTYTNNGKVIYGYQSPDGSWTSKSESNTSRTDTVSDSAFHNNGEMYVGKYNQAVALYGKQSLFHNEPTGKMFLGAMDMEGTNDRSNGVIINQDGKFINDGEITYGKKKGVDGTWSNSKIIYRAPTTSESDYAIKDTNNIISAKTSQGKQSEVSIINNSKITIGDDLSDLKNYVQNIAAINVEHSGNQITSTVKVENNGIINLGGYHSVGIRVKGKAGDKDTINNTGTINITGANNTGIYALNGAIINHTGTINVGGAGSVLPDNFAKRNYAIKSENGAVVNIKGANTQINLNADNVIGVYARQGGIINIYNDAKMTPDTTKENLVYYWISGRTAEGNKNSSQIVFKDATGVDSAAINLEMANKNSVLFRVDQGALFDTQDVTSPKYTFTVSGENSKGLYVANGRTQAKIGENTKLSVTGKNSTGIYVAGGVGSSGGVASIDAKAEIKVLGNGATAAIVDGNNYDINGKRTSNGTATLNSAANLSAANIDIDNGAFGYKVINSGILNHTGTIDFSGFKDDVNNPNATDTKARDNIVGVRIEGGTLNNKSNSDIKVNGIGIDIYKAEDHKSILNNDSTITATNGIAAVRINKDVDLTVKGIAGSLIKGEKEADAIRVHDGAILTTDDARIEVDGSGAGIHFMNTDSASTADASKIPTFTLSGTGIVDVKGTDATGILVQGANGDTATANFNSTGSKLQINVKDAGGHGITTNTSGYVYSGSNVTIESVDGGSALVVKGTTNDIKQSGTLISNSTLGSDAAVVDLSGLGSLNVSSPDKVKFENTGKIISNAANGVAIKTAAGTPVEIINTGSGIIDGDIQLNALVNDVILYGNTVADKIKTGIDQAVSKTTITLKNVKNENSTLAGYTNKSQSEILFNELDAGIKADNTNTQQGIEDTVKLDNSYYVLTDANKIKNFEILNIGAGSTFEVQNTDIALLESDANAQSGIKLDGTFKVTNVNDFTLNHKFKGDGVVDVNLSGKHLTMANAFSDFNSTNFTGILALTDTKFALDGTANTTTITNAKLQVGSGAIVTVADGKTDQRIGGLLFKGGRVEFQDPLSNLQLSSSVGNRANSLIKTGSLDVTNASGTIQVILDDMHSLPQGNIPVFDQIIEHDRGESLIHIIDSTNNNGISADQLKLEILYDQLYTQSPIPGNPLPNVPMYNNEYAIITDIQQGADGVVAKGTYDYGLELKADGLHVSYGLRIVDILASKNFVLTTSSTSQDKDLSAQIIGSGNLVIRGYNDISISNGSNAYTGQTIVDTGHFYLENDGVLGDTSNLYIKNGAQVSVAGRAGNITGTEQTAGALNIEKGGLLTLGSDKGLTVKGDSDSIILGNLVGLTGAHLTFAGGYTAIHSTNNDLDTDVKLQNDAVVQIYDAAGLGQIGSVDIDLDANLRVANHNPDSLFSKNLTGTGLFTVTTSMDANDNVIDSIVRLAGDNTGFTGNVVIGHNSDNKKSTLIIDEASMVGGTDILINRQGTLQLDHSGKLDWTIDKNITGQGGLAKTGSGAVLLEQSASNYTGKTTVYDGTLIAGDGDHSYVHSGSELEVKEGASFIGTAGTFNGSVMNHGEFIVGKTVIDEWDDKYIFTVKGNFINDGIIEMNNRFQSNINTNSNGNIGNQLHIGGDYIATGGAIILNTTLNDGFENTLTDSIHVAGNVIKQGQSTKLFVQNYGGLGASTQADAIKVIHVNGVSDPTAFILGRPAAIGEYEYILHKGEGENWYLQTYVEPDRTSTQRNVNPLIGGYLANMSAAFGMFNMTLHDRLGNPSYGQSFLNPNERGFSAWGRIVTSHQKYHAANHGLSISGDMYIAQVGADLIRVATEKDGSYRFGVMASYGSSDFKSRSRTTGTHAKGKIDQAGSIGLYGTWYQPEGWFVDAWLQYSHFKNEVSLQQQSSNKYNSNLWNASVEVGYNYKADSFDNGDYLIIQPNAQVIVGRLSSKSYTDYTSGLRVDGNKKNNVHVRVGAKLFYVPKTSSDNGFRPYIEANWIHNSSNMSATFNNSYSYSSNAPKNIYELKVGVEGELSKDWSVWGNVGIQKGKNHYKGHKATLGVKYTW